MGYGEFVGGGSVAWEISHTKGDHGNGGKHGGKGRDQDPGPGGVFTVWVINQKTGVGTFLGPYLTEDHRIKLEWGPRTVATTTAPRALKGSQAVARKSYKK